MVFEHILAYLIGLCIFEAIKYLVLKVYNRIKFKQMIKQANVEKSYYNNSVQTKLFSFIGRNN